MTKKRIGYRTLSLGVLFTALFFLLILRTFWIQVIKSDEIMAKASDVWERSSGVTPKRGAILDRNGEVLAYTSKAYTVIARLQPYSKGNQNYVKDREKTAEQLAPILGASAEDIKERLNKTSKQVELRPWGWKINEEQAKKVMALNLPGISLYEESRRYYPKGEFASHLLGYVDLDGVAQMGIEKTQNQSLAGIKGSINMKVDRKGNPIPGETEGNRPVIDGSNVVLTIDKQIQGYVEQALNEIWEKYQAKGITVIVSDPNTGEILGMGNRPSFNPNEYRKAEMGDFLNSAIGSNYEPGSTFKIVTLAAAIEEGLFNANETFMSGTYSKIKNAPPIKDHNGGKGWGPITFKEGVKRSSNVAFTILGYERLQRDRLFSYINKFGFGQRTGIELPGEESGLLNTKTENPRDIATMTFGQGVGVTAIQQVAAVGAIANGGNLMKPYLVKEIWDSKNKKLLSASKPKVVRRVVSAETSAQVRELLSAVVNEKNGTGQGYAMEGFQVAGKTGTAQVFENGKYMEGKYISSFIGFAPKDNPKLLIYVVVDQPEIDNQGAGGTLIAAPIFKSVMENSLRYLQYIPVIPGKTEAGSNSLTFTMPSLVGLTLANAEKQCNNLGLTLEKFGNGNTVIKQIPASGTSMVQGGKVIVLTSNDNVKMPDLKGKTLREVSEICELLGLKLVNAKGVGYVVSQTIPVGTLLGKGQSLQVELSPKNP